MSMASRYMCTRRYAPLKLVVCGVLLVLAALVVRAQAPIATTLLDGWRVGFNRHLDDEIREYASASGSQTIEGAQGRLGVQDSFPQQTGLPQLPLPHGAEHFSSAVSAILRSRGLPADLLGVVAVESGYDPNAVSPKGAAGLWQFMPATARQYGLDVWSQR